MSRQAILIDGAPLPGGAYSQGVVAGGFLYTAGFGPQDPETGLVVGDTVAEQTRSVLRNISAVLAAHGLELDDVAVDGSSERPRSRFRGLQHRYAGHFNAPIRRGRRWDRCCPGSWWRSTWSPRCAAERRFGSADQ